MNASACALSNADHWNSINWITVETAVKRLQMRIGNGKQNLSQRGTQKLSHPNPTISFPFSLKMRHSGKPGRSRKASSGLVFERTG